MSKIPGKIRPATPGLLELHVFFVPEEKWNAKLNKVAVEAIESFISAGFIRVYPDLSLETLRDELGGFLGTERPIDSFSFLKCVGRSLALVKGKQERELKVKAFVPPYAPQPELYLLPMVENSDSVLSRSLTPDRQSYHTDLQMFASAKSFCVPAPKKEATKFPPIKRRPLQQPPPTQSRQDSGSSSSSDEKDDLLSSQEPGWDEPQGHLGRAHERSQSTLEQAEVPPAAESQAKSKTSVMKGPRFHRNHTRDSGVPESLEDRDSGFSLSQDRKSKDSRPLKVKSKKSSDQVCNSPPRLSDPVQYPPPPANSRPAIATRKPIAPVFLTDRDELIKQIKLTKEERKQLERTRQGLLRKGKDLLAQNRYRRNQVRDSWKRKYFDTKKATEPLENTLKSLRQELEAFYHKLLHQLQARDGRHKAKGPGKLSNTKNELIIQIISESNEIDKLKKKVDDAKMKLVAEVKLREQATTELQTLKAELMQKKSQYCLSTRHSGVLGNGVGS